MRVHPFSKRGTSAYPAGFTMLEILLYLGLTAIILLSASVLFTMLLQARVKYQAISEVNETGMQVMQYVTQTIRNAEGITSPAAQIAADTTTLDVYTTVLDPTVFALASGVLTVREGAGAIIPLTSDRVTVSGLAFTNMSRAGTPGSLRIQFTLTHKNPSGIQAYDITKTFVTTATLRQP